MWNARSNAFLMQYLPSISMFYPHFFQTSDGDDSEYASADENENSLSSPKILQNSPKKSEPLTEEVEVNAKCFQFLAQNWC